MPAAGFPLDLLPGRGIAATAHARQHRSAVGGCASRRCAALRLVRRRRPRVVVVLGGYASVPCAFAAWSAARPDRRDRAERATPALANRLVGALRQGGGRVVRGHATAARRRHRQPAAARGDRPSTAIESREARGPSALPSVGDRWLAGRARINDATLELVRLWADRPTSPLRHVVGPRDVDAVSGERDGAARRPGCATSSCAYEERHADGCWPPPTWSCAAPAPGTWPSSPRSGCAACSCPGRARPRTTRPRTRASSSTPARPWWSATPSSTASRLEAAIDVAARRPGAAREAMAACVQAVARPDAAERVADLVEEHARVAERLDLASGPLAVHIVGVGGAGMSAIATVLAAMGHRCRAATSRTSAGPRAAPRPRRRRSPSATTRRERRARSTRSPSRPRSRRATPRSVAARERGIPVLRRAEILARHRRDAAHGRGRRARTARRRRRRCSRWSCVEAGLRPVVHHRRRPATRSAPARCGTTASGSSSRPTRATARSSSCRAEVAIVTNVEPDHLDHYGDVRRARGARSTRFLAEAPGPRVVCADDPMAARLGATPRRRSPTARATAADYRIGRPRGRARRRRVHARARRRAGSATVALPVPGLHNARNAAAALAMALELGAPFDAAGARARRASRASPAASSSAASAAASPSSTTTPTSRARSRPRSPRRADGGWRPGRRACSSPTATAAPRRCGRTSPTRSSTPTCSCSPTSTRPARRRARASRASSSSTPCSTPTRGSGSRGCPRRDDLVAYLGRRAARRATSASRSGAGDLTDAARRAARRLEARRVSRSRRPSRPRPIARRPGARATCRSAPLTTYRVGGRGRAVRRRATTTPTSRRSSTARRDDRHRRCSCVGRGSNLLVADAGFAGLAVVLGDAFADDRRSTAPTVHGRRRGARCRCSPAAPPPPGSPGFEWAVGVPGLGRRRGAHERRRPRLRHGRRRWSRVRVVDLRSGEDGVVPRRRPRPRLPPLGDRPPTQVVVAAELALAPGDRGRRRGRDRRDRALAARATSPAARTRARCSPTRPATPPAGSSTRRAARACGVGTAAVSDEARQLHPGRRRRLGRRRAAR